MKTTDCQSRHNDVDKLLGEIELIVKAYYELLDASEGNKAWRYKIEMEMGQAICYLLSNIEESD